MRKAAVDSARSEWRANWPVVLAGTAGMSLASLAMYSVGVMLVPIEQDLGWSRAQISSGPAVISIIMICLASVMGATIDRIGPRLVGIASATLACCGLALLSTVTANPWVWWSFWALLGVAGSSMPTVWTVPISRVFDKSRGLALGIVLSGSSIGAVTVPPLTGFYISEFGWRTAYLALAGTWAVLTLPVIVLFLRNGDRPAPRAKGGESKAAELPGVTAREGFRSPDYYKIAFGTLGGTFAGTALVMNSVPILSDGGIPLATAASVAALIGASMFAGRIAGGYLLDRFDAIWIAALSSLAPIAFCVAMLLFPGSLPAAIVGIVVYGLASGPKIAAVVYIVGQHFGQRSFGVLFGTIQALIAIGAGVGPFVANVVFDATGSYDAFMLLSIPVFIGCSVLFFFLKPPPPRVASQLQTS